MRCFWLGLNTDCNDILTEIITDAGICYTFNLLDRKDMFKDEMYVERLRLNSCPISFFYSGRYSEVQNVKVNKSESLYPYSVAFPGVKNSLLVAMQLPETKSGCLVSGFKVSSLCFYYKSQ